MSITKHGYDSKKVALSQKINTRKTANPASANKLSTMWEGQDWLSFFIVQNGIKIRKLVYHQSLMN